MPSRRVDPVTVEVVELIGDVVARYHMEYEHAAASHQLTGAQARVLNLLSLEPMPMRRIGQPSEVAEAVVWLSSARAAFITGTTLAIDGGKLAGTPPFTAQAREMAA